MNGATVSFFRAAGFIPRGRPRGINPAAWVLANMPVASLVVAPSGMLSGDTFADTWPPAPAVDAVDERDPGPMPESVSAERDGDGAWRCSFSFQSLAARRVALVGEFNGWNPAKQPLRKSEVDGTWTTTVRLDSGTYHYKFHADDGTWLHDPRNSERAPDGFGGFNSVLRLGRLARMSASEAATNDGRIETLGLKHDSERSVYRQWLSKRDLLVRYRTLAHDVQRVDLAVRGGRIVPMHVTREGPLFSFHEARLSLPESEGLAGQSHGGAEYTFILVDGHVRRSDVRTYVVDAGSARVMSTPEWSKHAVWYQIMVERFRNGDSANDPPFSRPWTSEWFTPSPWEGRDGQTFYHGYVYRRHYGGDLQGLEQRLGYLEDLGINAIYLNPIFEAESHHKYDATTYLHVDDNFGTKGDCAALAGVEDLLDPTTWQWTPTDRRFLRFLKTAHEMGFRVILDGVFNHVGTHHSAFQDVESNGRESRFADWFDVISWKPFRYSGWSGSRGLPVFKKSARGFACDAVRDHIFAVTRRWMDPNGDGDPSDGVDGWRLDVPNDVPRPFWVEWRRLVKSINPEAFITGEIWDRADDWLDGRHFDAVMNYQFAEAVVAWAFNRKLKIKVSELDRRLADLRMAYPAGATYSLQNLVDSHDTDRVASMAFNPDREYDRMNRPRDKSSGYADTKPGPADYRRVRLVALLQMTYVGAPMVYYGDEAGMWGADDPTNRKPMLWTDQEPYDAPEFNAVDVEQLTFYTGVISLRNTQAALRVGSFRTLLVDDDNDVWAFARIHRRERVVVVLNGSNVARRLRLPIPEKWPRNWRVIFGASEVERTSDPELIVRVPPVGGLVISSTE